MALAILVITSSVLFGVVAIISKTLAIIIKSLAKFLFPALGVQRNPAISRRTTSSARRSGTVTCLARFCREIQGACWESDEYVHARWDQQSHPLSILVDGEPTDSEAAPPATSLAVYSRYEVRCPRHHIPCYGFRARTRKLVLRWQRFWLCLALCW